MAINKGTDDRSFHEIKVFSDVENSFRTYKIDYHQKWNFNVPIPYDLTFPG